MRWLAGFWATLVMAACRNEETDATPATTSDTGATEGVSTATTSDPSTTDGSTTDVPATTQTNGTTEGSSGPACPDDAPPAAPSIVEPADGRIDVIGDDLVITASAFADPDPGDALGTMAVEIWTIDDGEPSERVWSAQVAGTSTVTLADGSFDTDTALGEWTDYLIRARYSDDHAECSAYGSWSDFLGFRTDDGSTALFDESVVRDFYLDIAPQSWNAIDAQAYPPGCVPFQREYYTGTLRYEDQVFEGVGIKTKGGCGSSRGLDGKASFKVNLEWDDPDAPGCPEERRLLGEKSFTFNNGVQDSTASHERLGYALFRELGIPAPRAASVRIFVNDELWGLYTHVEGIDRRFLSRWFASKAGMLYEGTYWCDLIAQNIGAGNDDDSYCLTREFSPDACTAADPDGDPLDYSRLHELIDQVETLANDDFYPAIEDTVDWDRFLTTWAIESVLAHWDNYGFHIQNNYRVYHDPTSAHWTLISTGIDQTFGDDLDPFDVGGVLAVQCLADTACEAAYAARLAEVTDAFASFGYEERADAIFDQLSPFVQDDPRREYSYADFVNQHDTLGWFIEQRPARMAEWLAAYGF